MTDPPADPGTPEATGGGPSGDLVGTILAGRYRILELLGEGAMGAVYLGEHVKIGRKDAIKVLRESMARDPEAIARFTRGARNSSQIRHRNVCTIYDFSDTSEGTQFLAMEYVAGESLSDLIEREGPLPVGRALDIAVQIAEGLQAAHDLGIVHRDLKPDNVMITRDRRGDDLAKVVDFDIAKGSTEETGADVTRLGFVIGTPRYMSPEQLTGERLDGRSDVYSLGIVLFRMLTGHLPFDGASSQELMINRLTKVPRRLDAFPGAVLFPEPLEEVLARAMERDVAARLESAESMATALREVRSVIPAPGAPSPGAAEAVPPTRLVPTPAPFELQPTPTAPASPPRAKRAVLPAAVAVALVVAAGGYFALSDRGPGPVTSVAVQPASSGLDVGQTVTLQALASDPEGPRADALVAWETSDAGVATVDAAGRVTGQGPGTAVIRASADGATGSSRVQVSSPAAAPSDRTEVTSEPAPDPGDEARPTEPPQPDARPTPLSPARVSDATTRFIAMLGRGGVAPGSALAVRDSAVGFLARSDLDDQTLGAAAYAAGLAELELGNPSAALDRIEQALRLDPDNAGYARMRDALRGTDR